MFSSSSSSSLSRIISFLFLLLRLSLVFLVFMFTSSSSLLVSAQQQTNFNVRRWPHDFSNNLLVEDEIFTNDIVSILQSPSSVNGNDFLNNAELTFQNVIFGVDVVVNASIHLRGREKIVFDNCEFRRVLRISSDFFTLSDNASLEVKNSRFTGDDYFQDEPFSNMNIEVSIGEPQVFADPNVDFSKPIEKVDIPYDAESYYRFQQNVPRDHNNDLAEVVKLHYWPKTYRYAQLQFPSIRIINNTFTVNAKGPTRNSTAGVAVTRSSNITTPVQVGDIIITHNTFNIGERLPWDFVFLLHLKIPDIFGDSSNSTRNAQLELVNFSQNAVYFTAGDNTNVEDRFVGFHEGDTYRQSLRMSHYNFVPFQISMIGEQDFVWRGYGPSIRQAIFDDNLIDFQELTKTFHFQGFSFSFRTAVDGSEIFSVSRNKFIKQSDYSVNFIEYVEECHRARQSPKGMVFIIMHGFTARNLKLLRIDNNTMTAASAYLALLAASLHGQGRMGLQNVHTISQSGNYFETKLFESAEPLRSWFSWPNQYIEHIEINNNTIYTACAEDLDFEANAPRRPGGKLRVTNDYCRKNIARVVEAIKFGSAMNQASYQFGLKSLRMNHNVGVKIETGQIAYFMDFALWPVFPPFDQLSPEERDSWKSADVEVAHNRANLGLVRGSVFDKGDQTSIVLKYMVALRVDRGFDDMNFIHVHDNYYNVYESTTAGNQRPIQVYPRFHCGSEAPYKNSNISKIEQHRLKDLLIENNTIIVNKYDWNMFDGISHLIGLGSYGEGNFTMTGTLSISNNNLTLRNYAFAPGLAFYGIFVGGRNGLFIPSILIENNDIVMIDVDFKGGSLIPVGVGSSVLDLEPVIPHRRAEVRMESLECYFNDVVVQKNRIFLRATDEVGVVQFFGILKLTIFDTVILRENIVDTELSRSVSFVYFGPRTNITRAEFLMGVRYFYVFSQSMISGGTKELIKSEYRFQQQVLPRRQRHQQSSSSSSFLTIVVDNNTIQGTSQLFSVGASLGSPDCPANISLTNNKIFSHRWTQALSQNASLATTFRDFIFPSHLVFLSSELSEFYNETIFGGPYAIPPTTISSLLIENITFDIEGFCISPLYRDMPEPMGDQRPVNIDDGLILTTKGVIDGTNLYQTSGLTRTVSLDNLFINNVTGSLKCIGDDFTSSSSTSSSIISNPVKKNLLEGVTRSISLFWFDDKQLPKRMNVSLVKVETTILEDNGNNNNQPTSTIDFSTNLISLSRKLLTPSSDTSPPFISLEKSIEISFFLNPRSSSTTIAGRSRSSSLIAVIGEDDTSSSPPSGPLLQIYLDCFSWNKKEVGFNTQLVKNSAKTFIDRKRDIQAKCIFGSKSATFSFSDDSKTISSNPSISHSDQTPTSTELILPKRQIYRPPPSSVGSLMVIGPIVAASASGAIQAIRKVDAFGDLRLCGNDTEIEDLEFDSNPMFLRIGNNAFQTYVGAAVGSLVVIVISIVLMAIVSFVVYQYRLKVYDLDESKERMMKRGGKDKKKDSSSSSSFFEVISSIIMKNNDDNTSTNNNSSNNKREEKKKEIWQTTIQNLRLPSLIGLVVMVVAFPAISSAATIFAFHPSSPKSKKQNAIRTDFDIILSIPAVVAYLPVFAYILYWMCVNLKKNKVKLNRPPPLEGSKRAVKRQEEYEQEFYEKKKKQRWNNNNNNRDRRNMNNNDPRRSNSQTLQHQQHPKILKTTPKYNFFLWRIWQFFNHPWTEWDGDHPWMKKFGAVIEPFAWPWFIFLDYFVGLVVASSVGASLACTDNSCCVTSASISLVACIIHTFVLFKVQPHHHYADNILNFTLSTLTLIIIILTLIELAVGNEMVLSSDPATISSSGYQAMVIVGAVNDFFSEAAIVVAFTNCAMMFMPIVVIPAAEFIIEQYEKYKERRRQEKSRCFAGEDEADETGENFLLEMKREGHSGRKKSSQTSQEDTSNESLDAPLLQKSKSGRRWQIATATSPPSSSSSPFRDRNNNNDDRTLSQMLLSPLTTSSPQRDEGRTQRRRSHHHHHSDNYDDYHSSRRNHRNYQRTSSNNNNQYRSRSLTTVTPIDTRHRDRNHHRDHLHHRLADAKEEINQILDRNRKRFENL